MATTSTAEARTTDLLFAVGNALLGMTEVEALAALDEVDQLSARLRKVFTLPTNIEPLFE